MITPNKITLLRTLESLRVCLLRWCGAADVATLLAVPTAYTLNYPVYFIITKHYKYLPCGAADTD